MGCDFKIKGFATCGMVKFQPVRAQCRLLPTFCHTILAVSHKRHAGMCHLQAYLVMTSGVQMNLKFGLVTFLTLRRQRDINRGRAAGNS